MECSFAIVTLILSFFFFFLSVSSFVILARVVAQTRLAQKKTHKLFLCFALMFSIAQLLDCVFWTMAHAAEVQCSAPQTENNDTLLVLAHLLPDAFFVSALSTTIHTVARLYHVVALEQLGCFNLFSLFLWAMNGTLYCITFAWSVIELRTPKYDAEDSFGAVFVWTMSAVEFSVAFTLLLYSGLLVRLFPHTMKVLFWMSAVCAFCICLKALLRIIPHNAQFQWWHPGTFAFFCLVTQLVPVALMLLLEARGTHRIFANTAFPSYGSHMFSQDNSMALDRDQPLFAAVLTSSESPQRRV